jgi:aspartate aminotransferase
MPLMTFINDSPYSALRGDPESCDFAFGNPHEMPLTGYVDALAKWLAPQNKDWFAYKMNEEVPRQSLATILQSRRGIAFEPEDIFLTTGAFAGLAASMFVIADPGDEIIFNSPPWFLYEPMILGLSLKPVRVNVRPDTFDLDLDAIANAITPKTRAVIVNSPNNPTGRIYPKRLLQQLADVLNDASRRHGHPIYILSDEAYCRIVFDNLACPSASEVYPNTFVIYTYGKTLLTPGQRMGYVALPPDMQERSAMRSAFFAAQATLGYLFPNALLQYAIEDIESLSIDIGHLQRRRDHMTAVLQQLGYEVALPEGTFYLLVRSPLADDMAFTEILSRHKVLVLPGSAFEMPGYFRISLTANDNMVQRALPAFESAIEEVQQRTTG